jgi:hypothetical protein
VETSENLLEIIKEKGKNTLVETPGKLVKRKFSEVRLTKKICRLRRIDLVFPGNGTKMLSHSL